MWSSNTTQTSIPAIAAQTTPVVIPAIPSVIITMQQITNLAAGPQGSAGITPNIQVGTVQSTPYGNVPQVTITGTSTNPLLNFVLETGQQGPQGERGPRGEKGETGGLDPADLALVEASATTAGAAAGGAAGASAGADAGAAAGAAAASALITPLEGEIATLQGQVSTLEGDVTTINTDLTELQQKTSNISAVTGVSTTITGTDGLYVDDITTLAITSPDILEIVSTTSTAITSSGAIEVATTSTLTLGGGTFSTLQSDTETSILAPIININSGASTGTINIGESLLDTVYIQGLPFVNFNLNPFSQW
jgi:hypothetical protein